MEETDPLQELLKSTGWSCDDLLEKLQKLKSAKSVTSDKNITSPAPPTEKTDISEEKTPASENLPKETEVVNENEPPSVNTETEPFSDTDDEEEEVHVTNQSIINEIIDDIATVDTPVAEEPTRSYETIENETSEVTEVRVIEVNDDEDDDFEEEFETKSSAKDIQYLETHPRQSIHLGNTVIGSKRSCEEQSDFEANSEKIEYIETHPRKRIRVLDNEKTKLSIPTSVEPVLQYVDVPGVLTNEVTNAPVDQNEASSTPMEISTDNHHSAQSSEKEEFIDTYLKFLETKRDGNSLTKKINDTTKDIDQSEKLHSENGNVGKQTSTLEDMQKRLNKTEKNVLNQNLELHKFQTDNNRLELTGHDEKTDPDGETGSSDDEDESNESSNDEDESNRHSPIDNESLNGDETTTSENVESIRSNLRLQLSSLRTRKKEHFLQTQTKVVDTIECNKKILNIISNEDDNQKLVNDEINVFEGEHMDSSSQITEGNDLFSQTNELGLVILDVQGGVDFNEIEDNSQEPSLNNEGIEESTQCDGNTSEHEKDDVHHIVLNQIREIIHKQKTTPKINDEKVKPVNAENSHIDSQNSGEKCTPSTENSQSSFTNDNHGKETKSPFVSDSLDEFLIGDSELKISYNVPKSGAEEGLKGIVPDVVPVLLPKVPKIEEIPKENTKKSSMIKAKTVAQKRKLLERENKKEQRKLDKLRKANNLKVKTESKKEDKFFRSFILYNNEKLWVRSNIRDTCLAKVGCQNLMKKSPMNIKRKLSLLDSPSKNKKTNMQIKYRPGPLCKKSELQISDRSHWETLTKNLPRIFLEVVPKIGQCFPDHITNRLKFFDGKLYPEQIEFALSTLKTKKSGESEPRPFLFPLQYHNKQEQIIVRKHKLPPARYSPNSSMKEDNRSRNTVADVIDDLIRYVEIKEIAHTLIKEDETQMQDEEKPVEKLSPINSNVSVFKKPPKRKSKVEHELLRLNCKLVNVEVEENLNEEKCGKLHCQLGCICKALKCENVSSYHCQLVQCMFECSCPKERALIYEHSLTLPAGTDILSTDTVNRIEDEAKKDLAKVEREFTQTVIHTNDRTIVVGLGRRSKLRRNTRTPAKYSDYVDSTDTQQITLPYEELTRTCMVKLPRLNFSQIIPYCLSHNLYDCHCKGTSPFVPKLSESYEKYSEKVKKINTKFTGSINEHKNDNFKTTAHINDMKKLSSSGKEEAQKSVNTPVQSRKSSEVPSPIDKYSVTRSEERLSESSGSNSHVEENINTASAARRPIRNKKKKKYDEDFIDSSSTIPSIPELPDCSRTRALSEKYMTRKAPDVNVQEKDFFHNITDSDLFQAKLHFCNSDRQQLEVDILKQSLIEQRMGNIFPDMNKNKRKQTLSARNEENSSIATHLSPSHEGEALQRRKQSSIFSKDRKVKAVFDGEIIIDRRNSELLKKMGPKTVQNGYARLLPWKALTESFKTGEINIWCMVDQPSRLLINKSNRKVPKNYVNIKESNQTTEVILWILRNKLPSNYREDSVSFILKETKNNFEICGVCTRHFTQEDLTSNTVEEKSVAPSEEDGRFVHTDINGDQQLLDSFKTKFKLQELVEESIEHLGEMSVDKNKLYMWAELPDIYPVCKWRMFYLNSDFSYLFFSNIEYSIRYTDLLNAIKIAKNSKCTLRLTNTIINSAYDHKDFGLYFDPSYSDRFFVGPYFKQFSGNDVETYRFIKKSLISTESFKKMTGKSDYKCSHWLVERPYSRKQEPSISTIDLTNDDDASNATVEVPASSKKQRANKGVSSNMVIMHNSEQILIIDAPSRKPEDFNRYIISNIPHLGYLGAYRHPNGEMDVSWPFEEKLLRFPNATIAIDFLQERFSALLQPVPENFKINIIVLTQIDLKNASPIDAAVLSGHYICGEFGFENITTMTNEDCISKLGISREAILAMFSKRAKLFLGKRIENLASLLNIHENDGHDISRILDAATVEIRAQIDQEKNNIAERNELLVKKRNTAIRLFQMISKLPPKRRNAESMKFRMILHKTEPIEIRDSDEEGNKDIDTNKERTVSKDNADDHLNGDILKVLQPQQCLMSVLKAKNQAPVASCTPKDSDLITSPSMTSSSPGKAKQKSILKPLIRVPIDSDTSLLARGGVPSHTEKKQSPESNKNFKLQSAQYISGVKLVKSVNGNFVLVPDDAPESAATTPELVTGTKVIIQNSKIKALKKFSTQPKLKKIGGENLRLVPTKTVECELIESSTDIDTLNADGTLVIDLDIGNELDNLLIQNNENLIGATDDSYDNINENTENEQNKQYRYSDDSSEVITIIEDDVLPDTEENFQNENKEHSENTFVGIDDITHKNALKTETTEKNDYCSNAFREDSDDDFVIALD